VIRLPVNTEQEATESTESARNYSLLAAFGALVLLAIGLTVWFGLRPDLVAGSAAAVATVYAFRRQIFSWKFLLFAITAMIMFVPGRAYSLPISLPFQLEPYRLLWALAVVVIFYGLFVSRRRSWRPIAFGWGVATYLLCVLASFAVNGASLAEQGLVGSAVGAVISFLILLIPFFVVRQLLDSEQLVRRFLVFLVWSGVVVSFFALLEYITRTNFFRLYNRVLPLRLLRDELGASTTVGAFRAFGSAQHPIALAVMLSTLVPVAVWLAAHAEWPKNPINRQIVYGLAMIGLFGGIVAAISRTAVVVLGTMFFATLVLKPALAGRLVVAGTPVMVGLALLRPRVFGSVFLSFLDPEALIASQYTSAGWAGQGRLADLAPALAIVAQHPFFGTGLGSRILFGEHANSFILDNQWLGNLMDLGYIGLAGLVVFMLLPVAKLGRYAFVTWEETRFANLAVAIMIATLGYSVAMYFFDAFAFIQSFIVLSLLWAVGGWLLHETPQGTTIGLSETIAA
jgi:polysaccharide biosynthesis protein PslJ